MDRQNPVEAFIRVSCPSRIFLSSYISLVQLFRTRARLVHFEQRRLYTGSLIENEEIVVLPSALISSEGLVHVIGTEGFACSDFI